MRINEKELASFSHGKSDKEGRLNHKAPGFREGRTYKERWFKLKGNLLFYFRLNEYGGICESEPAGILVLEHCKVQEENDSELAFVFSVVFFDDKERKHMFGCPTEKHCQEWVAALSEASYEHQRVKLLLMQARILKKTGKDPLAAFSIHKQEHRPVRRLFPKTKSVPEGLPLL